MEPCAPNPNIPVWNTVTPPPTPKDELVGCVVSKWGTNFPTVRELLAGAMIQDPLTGCVSLSVAVTPTPIAVTTVEALNCDGTTTTTTVKDEAPTQVVISGSLSPIPVCVEGAMVELGGYEACYDGTPAHIEIIRDEDGTFIKYVAHLKDGSGTIVDPAVVALIGTCVTAKQVAQVPNCSGTLDDKPVDEINAVYLLNQENKHTETVYDNITATLSGTIDLVITGTDVSFDFSGIVATNWLSANYLVDFGNGYTDFGGSPSFDFVNEPDGHYEIKVFRMFVYPTGAAWHYVYPVEIQKTGSTITAVTALPASVNRSISYTQKAVLQDFCGALPVGVPYTVDGSAATINGVVSLTQRVEKNEWLGVTDANGFPVTELPATLSSGAVSIADGVFAAGLGPDGISWSNPGGLKSVTILARKSNLVDAVPGSGSNQILVNTTDTKFVLLEGESYTFSVEDNNILDFVSVEALKDAAASVTYVRS